MQNANKKSGAFSPGKISSTSTTPDHRRQNLYSFRLASSGAQSEADFYEIVPDGVNFGIALRGEVKIRGMELEEAQNTVAILNRVRAMEINGWPSGWHSLLSPRPRPGKISPIRSMSLGCLLKRLLSETPEPTASSRHRVTALTKIKLLLGLH